VRAARWGGAQARDFDQNILRRKDLRVKGCAAALADVPRIAAGRWRSGNFRFEITADRWTSLTLATADTFAVLSNECEDELKPCVDWRSGV
jgi:hypothetical protein